MNASNGEWWWGTYFYEVTGTIDLMFENNITLMAFLPQAMMPNRSSCENHLGIFSHKLSVIKTLEYCVQDWLPHIREIWINCNMSQRRWPW